MWPCSKGADETEALIKTQLKGSEGVCVFACMLFFLLVKI